MLVPDDFKKILETVDFLNDKLHVGLSEEDANGDNGDCYFTVESHPSGVAVSFNGEYLWFSEDIDPDYDYNDLEKDLINELLKVTERYNRCISIFLYPIKEKVEE